MNRLEKQRKKFMPSKKNWKSDWKKLIFVSQSSTSMKNTEKKPLSSLKKGNLKKRSKKRAKKGDLKQTQQPQVQRFKKNLKN